MSDFNKIAKILTENSEKSFVKRILNRDQFPVLDNEDGTVSTHSMAYGETEDGRFFVYPTVLMTDKGLKRFGDNDAWRETQGSGNFIEFGSGEEADWFSKNYKKVWK